MVNKGNGKIIVPLPTKLETQAARAQEIVEMEQTLHECAKELHVLEWRAAQIERTKQTAS